MNTRLEAHKCGIGVLTREALVSIGSGPNIHALHVPSLGQTLVSLGVTAQRVNCDIALEEQILNTSARGECGEKHYM